MDTDEHENRHGLQEYLQALGSTQQSLDVIRLELQGTGAVSDDLLRLVQLLVARGSVTQQRHLHSVVSRQIKHPDTLGVKLRISSRVCIGVKIRKSNVC